jgi:small subunit ribosomal protein S17
MAEEEKNEQEEKAAADEQAPEEEPAAEADEKAPSEEAEAEEPRADTAEGEEAPADTAEGEAAGASDEVADEEAVPAAASEPEPADTGRQAEDDGGDVQEEALHPKQIRKRERSRASGPARPQRSPEERAAERAERRSAAAERRRRYRAGRRRKRGEPGTGTPPAPREPGPKKVRQGTVVSTGGDKTITVEIAVVRRHTTYEKVVRRTSKLRAHDEGNEARRGDVVRVVESRPLSRTKRWRLLDVLERAPR